MEEHLPHGRGVAKALNEMPGWQPRRGPGLRGDGDGFPRSCWRDAVRRCHSHGLVTIWFCFQGLENEYQEEGQLLGQFMFDQEGESLQTFPVPVSTCHAHWSQPWPQSAGPAACLSKLPEGVAQPREGSGAPPPRIMSL